MSGFLDHLLARGGTRTSEGAAPREDVPALLRPRTPALFEPATANGAALTALPGAQDGEAQAQEWSSQPAFHVRTPVDVGHLGHQTRAPLLPAAGEPPPAPGLAQDAAPSAATPDAPSAEPAQDHVPVHHVTGTLRPSRDDAGLPVAARAAGPDADLAFRLESMEALVRRLQHQPVRDGLAASPAPDAPGMRADATQPGMPSAPAPAGAPAAAIGLPDLSLRARLQARASQSGQKSAMRDRSADANRAAAQPEPSIHVSIGRIEIRATAKAGPAAPAARKETPGPRAISLDEYLQQRATGARK